MINLTLTISFVPAIIAQILILMILILLVKVPVVRICPDHMRSIGNGVLIWLVVIHLVSFLKRLEVFV